MRLLIFFVVMFILACNNHQASISSNENDSTIESISDIISDSSLFLNESSEEISNSIDTILLGNLDDNTINDTAFIQVFNPMNQTVSVIFSSGLPTLTHANGFGGYLIVLEDFDADGYNEILYFPDWFSSNWAGYFIYTLKNKKWQLMAEGTCTRDAVSGANSSSVFLKSRVKKINENTLQLINHEMNEDGDIIEVKRDVKF